MAREGIHGGAGRQRGMRQQVSPTLRSAALGVLLAAIIVGCAATPEPVVLAPPATPPAWVTIAEACDSGSRLDADADGWLGLFEFAGYAQTAFPAWDGDADGAISPAEFAACWLPDPSAPAETAPGAVFPIWDADGDGRLVQAEFFAWAVFAQVSASI